MRAVVAKRLRKQIYKGRSQRNPKSYTRVNGGLIQPRTTTLRGAYLALKAAYCE